jgi:hypothetical protein
MNGGLVVGEHLQLDAAQVEPVVGQVQGSGHEQAAHALAPGVGVDHQAQAARMFEPGVKVAGDVNRANHPALPVGDESVTAVLFALGPFFGLTQLHARQLQQLAGHARLRDHRVLVVGVVGMKRPYFHFSGVNR